MNENLPAVEFQIVKIFTTVMLDVVMPRGWHARNFGEGIDWNRSQQLRIAEADRSVGLRDAPSWLISC